MTPASQLVTLWATQLSIPLVILLAVVLVILFVVVLVSLLVVQQFATVRVTLSAHVTSPLQRIATLLLFRSPARLRHSLLPYLTFRFRLLLK